MSEATISSKTFSSCNQPLQRHRAGIVTGGGRSREFFMVGLDFSILLFSFHDRVMRMFLGFSILRFYNLGKKNAGLSQ